MQLDAAYPLSAHGHTECCSQPSRSFCVCRALLSPIVWPISLVLDWMLGRDIGTVYSREELKRLIDIHVMDPDAQAESGLTRADQRLIIGAFEYKNKRFASLSVLILGELYIRGHVGHWMSPVPSLGRAQNRHLVPGTDRHPSDRTA